MQRIRTGVDFCHFRPSSLLSVLNSVGETVPNSARSKRCYQDALTALQGLEEAGFEARLAGGCVRDRQMNKAPADYDIATTATPEEVTRTFKEQGRKVVPTGIEHGTVTLVMPAGPVEITTLRRDVVTDGRRAQVEFGTSFEEDAARRDFTINAMFEDRAGKIFDYHDGLSHLQAGKLYFVGDPHTRIKEDYLRILRFFRFWARFNLQADVNALKAIKEQKDGLRIVSQERITSELLLLLATENPTEALKAMSDTGVFNLILPEVQHPLPKQLAEANTVSPAWRPLVRFSMLLPETTNRKKVLAICERLRLSNKQKAIAMTLRCEFEAGEIEKADDAMLMHEMDAWENVTGVGTLMPLILPAWRLMHPLHTNALNKIADCESQFGILRQTPLPLSGDDIRQALGLTAGPKLGKLLELLKRDFRNRLWATKEEGLSRAKKHLERL